MERVDAHELFELTKQYQSIVDGLAKAIDERTKAMHTLEIAKGEVLKYTNQKQLIEEEIRCYKKLIDAGK